jgi:hypothetical protein
MAKKRGKQSFIAQGTLVFLLAVASVGQVFGVAKGYNTEDPELKTGMVVAIDAESTVDNPKVERASTDNAERTIGIVTSEDSSTVSISSGDKKVLVETDGEIDAYVSDIGGEVKQGDLLEVSPLKGILMKSDGADGIILGIALEDANLPENESYSRTIEGDDQKTTTITKVRISLDQKAISTLNSDEIDSSLERLGASIVGREVSEIRVIVAMIIFVMVLIAEGGIIYGAVSSAITSMGRNPLAKDVIRSEVIRVVFIAMGVLVIGLVALYMILWV